MRLKAMLRNLRRKVHKLVTMPECCSCKYWDNLYGQFGKCEREKEGIRAYDDVCMYYREKEVE